MTGPEGDQHSGWWGVIAVDPPHRMELEDGFADGTGEPERQADHDHPGRLDRVRGRRQDHGGRVHVPDLEAMENMVAMGMEEGMTLAIGQIDGLLS